MNRKRTFRRSALSAKKKTTSETSATFTLGLRLFGEINEPNAVLSPISVHLALQLAALGATHGSANASELHAALGHPISSPRADDGPLTTATAIFTDDSVLPAFIAAAKELAPLPSAVGPINEWVSSATKAEISTILEWLPAETEAVLLSAAHFAALWRYAFDPAVTEDAFLYPSVEEQTKVCMMTLKNKRLPYAEASVSGSCEQALELPYAHGYSELVLLPEAGGLDSLARTLGGPGGAAEFQGLRTALHPVIVDSFGLPHFRVEAESNLKEVLQRAGVREAFNDVRGSDFMHVSKNLDTVLVDAVQNVICLVLTRDKQGALG